MFSRIKYRHFWHENQAYPYSYRLRATDAAGNLSSYSNIASATTLPTVDTSPPTAPTGLSTSVFSSSQIVLGWTPSTDNVGVTAYLMERCQGLNCTAFNQIGSSAALNYSDMGLTASTTYTYRIRASDAAGNLSGYSTGATTTTISGANSYTYDTNGNTTVLRVYRRIASRSRRIRRTSIPMRITRQPVWSIP